MLPDRLDGARRDVARRRDPERSRFVRESLQQIRVGRGRDPVIDAIGSEVIQRFRDGVRAAPLSCVNGSAEAEGAGAGVDAGEGRRRNRSLVPSQPEADDRSQAGPLVDVEHPLCRLRSPLADRVEEDAAPGRSESFGFPEAAIDLAETLGGVEPAAGGDLRGHVDLGVSDPGGLKRCRDRRGGLAVIAGGGEERADLRVEREKALRVADPRAVFLEQGAVGEAMSRPSGEDLEKLDRQRSLEMKVTVRQSIERGHGERPERS